MELTIKTETQLELEKLINDLYIEYGIDELLSDIDIDIDSINFDSLMAEYL